MTDNQEIFAATDAATVSRAAPLARFVLRARGDTAPLSVAIGVKLPEAIGTRSAARGIEAICLGPDEWMLHAPVAKAAAIADACAAIYGKDPHSLVDVSAREVTLMIDGPRAAELLTLGCPRDIATIPSGQGRRTVFDGVTVILWRDGDTRFRMDVWRSFAPHVEELLVQGCAELAAESAAT